MNTARTRRPPPPYSTSAYSEPSKNPLSYITSAVKPARTRHPPPYSTSDYSEASKNPPSYITSAYNEASKNPPTPPPSLLNLSLQ